MGQITRRITHIFLSGGRFYIAPSAHGSVSLRNERSMLKSVRSFTCQAPLALVCLAFMSFNLTADHQKTLKTENGDSGQVVVPCREVDWFGAVFSAIGLVFGLAALSMGGRKLPWSHPLVLLAITGCIIFMAAFAITELFWARSPLISPKVIARNEIGVLCVIQILLCTARFGVSNQENTSYIPTADTGRPQLKYRPTLSALKKRVIAWQELILCQPSWVLLRVHLFQAISSAGKDRISKNFPCTLLEVADLVIWTERSVTKLS